VKSLVFRPEARADALEAFDFYERRQSGLGGEFRRHLDFALSRIAEAPERYPFIYRDLRRRLVERFPYVVLYRVYTDTIVVVAVMHGRQNPSVWKRRA
jgi:plasmid stabilization system protein ParE